jgi:hypothetical protein
MTLINRIQEKFKLNQFEFSKHAADRMILRHITVTELREVIQNGEIIEDYPQDKYGPSCLILGYTGHHRPLHVQCSYPVRPIIKIVTIYEPDPDEWIDSRKRKN